MATVGSSVRTDPEANPAAGPAHVAVVSFLASRVVPSGGFWVALAGGIALARVSERNGPRVGYGTSTASMLETVAIIGPLRFGIPLTQAVTAPMLGRFIGRGMALWLQVVICAVLRLLQNAIQTAFFIFVLAGGLDAVTGTYDRIAGIVGLEVNNTGTLILTAVGLVAWAVFASIVQVLVYVRGLARWDGVEAEHLAGGGESRDAPPADAGASPAPPAAAASPAAAGSAPATVRWDDPRPTSSRFDPRLLALIAVVLFGVLLSGTKWIVLGAVALALALLWVISRPDPAPLRAGLAFTAFLAASIFLISMIGGLGIEVAVARALRAALLVLTATWLRCAARAEGLRFAFRRALYRLRRIPSVPEASVVLDSLESEGRLATSARAFAESLEDVPTRPVPFTDAVIGWVVRESSAARRR